MQQPDVSLFAHAPASFARWQATAQAFLRPWVHAGCSVVQFHLPTGPCVPDAFVQHFEGFTLFGQDGASVKNSTISAHARLAQRPHRLPFLHGIGSMFQASGLCPCASTMNVHLVISAHAAQPIKPTLWVQRYGPQDVRRKQVFADPAKVMALYNHHQGLQQPIKSNVS